MQQQNYGYIYIRTNEYWDTYNSCKLGKTENIINRENNYVTSELKRGRYILVLQIILELLDLVEKKLQIEFTKYNIYNDAGTEFYNKEIINLILPFLDKENIKYKILSDEEIDNLIAKKYISYIPREYQTNIIDNALEYYKNNNKGLLVIPCGVGKTLISLWIAMKLNIKKILIGVPNRLLLHQWNKVINQIFDIPKLLVYGNIQVEEITRFLEKNKESIVITTYSSVHKIYKALQYYDYIFDLKIHDEAHHLTSINKDIEEKKNFIKILKIKSEKELSLTATLKVLENIENKSDEEIIISNDNIEYFGEIIEKRSLLWAIKNNIICDYVIQTIITFEEEINRETELFGIIEENDKRMFLSAYSSLKSIQENNSHHLLVYCNNQENTIKIMEYIKLLIDNKYFEIHELYYSNYHSEIKNKEQKEILDNFENSKYGIISCVYCLGEGWDFPLLDGVVFSENMSSNIRIVQSALRASRKNMQEPEKITKMILPILNFNNVELFEDIQNQDLKKIKEVIYQISLEDNLITEKIKVFHGKINNNIKNKEEKNEEIYTDLDKELTELLKLKTIRRINLEITYEKAKKIISNYNIHNKQEYYELCKKNYRLPESPELTFKEKFKNWIDYLSIERKYYNLEMCKKKIREYEKDSKIKINHLDLASNCIILCNIDNNFPPYDLWTEYYEIGNLNSIFDIYNRKKKKSGII
jgi:predicted helicase